MPMMFRDFGGTASRGPREESLAAIVLAGKERFVAEIVHPTLFCPVYLFIKDIGGNIVACLGRRQRLGTSNALCPTHPCMALAVVGGT